MSVASKTQWVARHLLELHPGMARALPMVASTVLIRIGSRNDASPALFRARLLGRRPNPAVRYPQTSPNGPWCFDHLVARVPVCCSSAPRYRSCGCQLNSEFPKEQPARGVTRPLARSSTVDRWPAGLRRLPSDQEDAWKDGQWAVASAGGRARLDPRPGTLPGLGAEQSLHGPPCALEDGV